MSAAEIQVSQVSVAFQPGGWVLRDICLTAQPGQIISLLGPSGCGKSTLLRIIARLLVPNSGSVAFHGESAASRTGDLAFVFQDATLLPWRTVWENVRLPLEISHRRMEHSDSLRAITSTLESVGLPAEDWKKFPRQLSGGMRMRCSLARALVTDPSVMLLDEPFAALDDMLRTRMNELLLELWQTRQRTIVFVTHNIAEALYLSHRVAILGGGRIAEWLENPLEFPRVRSQRSSQQFAQLYGQVSNILATVTA